MMVSNIESQDDVAHLIGIFSAVWGAETLSEFVSNIQSNTCLLVRDGTSSVVGYLFYDIDDRTLSTNRPKWETLEDDVDFFVEITDLGVSKDVRNQGFGRTLVEHIQSMTDTVRLSVKENNLSARSLYKSLGFKEIKVYQNYYGVGHDGIRMEWKRNG